MKVNYNQFSKLLTSTPYTWGGGEHWYALLPDERVICLNSMQYLSAQTSEKHRAGAINYVGFRYAVSMEVI